MKILEHGWLVGQPEMAPFVGGVFIPPETRTRKEEYTFALEKAPVKPGLMLDVATGFIPEWHLFAYIMALHGWIVVAIDENPLIHQLPRHSAIHYKICRGERTPYEDNRFDYVTCISTLEHCSRTECRQIVAEMERVCVPGGKIVVTADFAPWLPILFGGDFDRSDPPWGLDPSVYYVVAEK